MALSLDYPAMKSIANYLEKSKFHYHMSHLGKKQISQYKIDVGLSFSAPHIQNWMQNETGLMIFGFEANRNLFRKYHTLPGFKKRTNYYVYLEINGNFAFLFPIALGAKTISNRKLLYIPAEVGQSSLHQINRTITSSVDSIKVPVWSLDDFLQTANCSEKFISHLKIDTQGHDLEVLRGARATLPKVLSVTYEVPPINQYFDVPDNEEIETFLNQFQFISVSQNRPVRRLIARLIRLKLVNMLKVFLTSHGLSTSCFVIDEVGKPKRKFIWRLRRFRIQLATSDPTFFNNLIFEFSKQNILRIYQSG